MTVARRELRGWEVLRVASDELSVDVVPAKGGDVLAVVPAGGPNLLWESPWGLRPHGSLSAGGSSHTSALEAYPGGWQTMFPNAGDETEQHGVTWGFHGETWLAPFEWVMAGPSAVQLTTRLVRSPFTVSKLIEVADSVVTITETVQNEGRSAVEVMWGHHPAFGAPLVGVGCRLETNAACVVVDDVRDTPTSDLVLGAAAPWPQVPGRDGRDRDLRIVPGPDTRVDRFSYLTEFDGAPWVRLRNAEAGWAATLSWDRAVMPHAWYWLESHATEAFPWYGGVYVLAIEPCSSYPGQGLAAAKAKTASVLTVGAGASRTARVSLSVERIGG